MLSLSYISGLWPCLIHVNQPRYIPLVSLAWQDGKLHADGIRNGPGTQSLATNREATMPARGREWNERGKIASIRISGSLVGE